MFKQITYTLIFIVSFMFSPTSIANNEIKIDYNERTDILKLEATDVYLDFVLQKLSDEIQFKLSLEGEDLHRKISLSMTGTSLKVIEQLVKPNSVILSQSESKPHKVTDVILLPIGEQSKESKIREKMRKPRYSEDAEENAKRQQQYERRIQRKLMGLGRTPEPLQENASEEKH